jgi:hypothetical protein
VAVLCPPNFSSELQPGRNLSEEPATTIQSTEQQQQAPDAEQTALPRVVDPRTNRRYVLVPEGDYEAIREAPEEERRQQAIRGAGLWNAAGRMEDSP